MPCRPNPSRADPSPLDYGLDVSGSSVTLLGVELLVARNPNPSSSLPYLLRVPVNSGLVFRTKGTWPRTNALYCHPADLEEWPDQPEIVERVGLRVCARRGAAIDLVCDRGRESRSQIVFTRARGREVVFWQSPRTRKQSRPDVRLPTARAQGFDELEVLVDAHERYPFSFPGQKVRTVRRALACGDYAVSLDGRIVCAVERKSLDDLVASLTTGRLRYAISELASLPRAAVVVEGGYSRIFGLKYVRGAVVADDLAELQVRCPNVPVVHCETRKLAEEWTYRYLAAAHAWAGAETAAQARIATATDSDLDAGPPAPPPSISELRAWARAQGLVVSDRGRISQVVRQAYEDAHALGADRGLTGP